MIRSLGVRSIRQVKQGNLNVVPFVRNNTTLQKISARQYSHQEGGNNSNSSTFRKVLRYGGYFLGGGVGLIVLTVGVSSILHKRTSTFEQPDTQPKIPEGRKRVVVLGTGWGATSLIKALDPKKYDVIVVSPRNYFLFTPLLPSCTVGTLEPRSIIQSIRYIIRHKSGNIGFIEGECTKIDAAQKFVQVNEACTGSEAPLRKLQYDYLVVACGGETATYGLEGIKEHALFLKELWDAKKIRAALSDRIEAATSSKDDPELQKRLLHMVVVGGGPTGIEYAAELHDYLKEDLNKWYPDIADKVVISLIEALPSVLPSFNKELIKYTESTFKDNRIDVHTKTAVQKITKTHMIVKNPQGELEEVPYGLLVWAAGNTVRPVVRDLMNQFPKEQTNRRGVSVDDQLRMKGSDSIFVIGDASTTSYAPTAQVANQQGKYLSKLIHQLASGDDDQAAFKKQKPFQYTHNGSLAYIGSEKAIADIPIMSNINLPIGGPMTYLFWKSVYLSNLFSVRNATLIVLDWAKKFTYGRDISKE